MSFFQQFIVITTLLAVIDVYSSIAQTIPRQTVSVSRKSTDSPTAEDMQRLRTATNLEIQNVLQNTGQYLSLNETHNEPNCNCGGDGWTEIINYVAPSSSCPSGWDQNAQGCQIPFTRDRGNSVSATIPTGRTYTRVCGRVNAIQTGRTIAYYRFLFRGADSAAEDDILDGVTLSHGPVNSRQHIWSFIAANSEDDADNPYVPTHNCPCTNTIKSRPYVTPQFINNDYFCDTGNPGPRAAGASPPIVFSSNPLWDGVGCGPNNACCTFNSPPTFCKTLPQSTSNAIEARISRYFETGFADIVVTRMQLFIQ